MTTKEKIKRVFLWLVNGHPTQVIKQDTQDTCEACGGLLKPFWECSKCGEQFED